MNADRIAAAYRWMEYAAFGRALERCRYAGLEAGRSARRILIVGEGDGRFLSRLARANGAAEIHVVEKSGRMIELARARLATADLPRVHFHCRDAVRDPLPDGRFDTAITQFVLDCLLPWEAALLASKLDAALTPGGSWVIAEFHIPPRGLRRLHARVWLAILYRFFRWSTGLGAVAMPPWQEFAKARGFHAESERHSRFDLLTCQVWRR